MQRLILGVTWFFLFAFFGAFLLVLAFWLWPHEDMRAAGVAATPFRVLVSREADGARVFNAPEVGASLRGNAQVCAPPGGDLVAALTRDRTKTKIGNATCYYEIWHGTRDARAVQLECGLNEFVYEVHGGCATPVERKLLNVWHGLIAALLAVVVATLGTLGMRRLL